MTTSYENPVIPGFYPDPSVCRSSDDYYLVTSSFEYFPGIPLFHSRDLVHWRQIGHCLTRNTQIPLRNCPSSSGVFAPTIRHHAGTFYLVSTNMAGYGHFIVSARDPQSSWSEPIPIEGAGFDPSLHFDTDGRCYFSWSNIESGRVCICQTEFDPASGQHLSEVRELWSGTGGKFPEASHLYRIGDFYYLLLAEGGTEYGHMVTVARSSTPWGPFASCPRNPILSHRSTALPIQATGHADLIRRQDGSWWIVFLGTRPHGYPPVHHLGRETFLAPVVWDDAGWPIVGDNGRVGLTIESDMLSNSTATTTTGRWRDDFDNAALQSEWNFVRNPDRKDWSLEERPGSLCLHGSRISLDDVASPAFVGRRQQHFEVRVRAALEFDPLENGEEAGLTVRMNEAHHCEIALTRVAGKRSIIVRRRIGSLSATVAQVAVSTTRVILFVDATTEVYAFGFEDATNSAKSLATAETRYVSTEVAGGFTGVYLGLYATGNGAPCRSPAYFDWFEYLPKGAG